MYDFAHPIEDAIEGITHSICTLNLRIIVHCMIGLLKIVKWKACPRQYEFGRLNLTNTVMSKRKLKASS